MRIERSLLGASVAVALSIATACVASIGNRGAATVPSADVGDGYRIETVRLDDGGVALFKYRPDSGQAWFASPPDYRAWTAVGETEDVPTSLYAFTARATGGATWTMVRLDTRSGRTWVLRDAVWAEVESP